MKIGILGGGQLARMSLIPAVRLGFDVAILEKSANSPAGKLTKNEFIGWVDDKIIFNKFIDFCDIFTLENEFIDFKYIEAIEKSGKKCVPSSKTVSLIQDKLIQKKVFSDNKIPLAKFTQIDTDSNYESISLLLGKKFVVKSRKMGYDGYGNALVKNRSDFSKALIKLKSRNSDLYAESFVNFKKELATIIIKSKNEIKTYPIVESIQKNHICKLVIAEADIPNKIKKEVIHIAHKCIEAIEGEGIFGIEFFLTSENKLLVNEIAPRPHNTGHYTLDACVTSQFENHILSVLGLPLGETFMLRPKAVMINILGKNNGTSVISNYSSILKQSDLHLHLYGKDKSRKGRKMGHITAIGNSVDALLIKVKKADRQIKI
ncbi:MAG: 5-(carboxyamino)imidazole ribonucleotide synthase [Melioribacteraceae bacterium]|nr:5-(carboxyamino)imidazole ribonucleotide synthase [Melioribacteraceae bacterium]